MFHATPMSNALRQASPYELHNADEKDLRLMRPLVGIEIEAEVPRDAQRLPEWSEIDRGMTNWERVADHSLRDHGDYRGHEWVSAPLRSTRNNLLSELSQFHDILANRFHTPRAGVHVHVNCRPLMGTEFLAGLYSYYLIEPIIYDFVGGGREQNIFCVPLREERVSAMSLCKQIADYIQLDTGNEPILQRRSIVSEIERIPKYLGLGLRTLGIHGTVESRHMAMPTAEDWDRQVISMAVLMAQLFAPSDIPINHLDDLFRSIRMRLLTVLRKILSRYGVGQHNELHADGIAEDIDALYWLISRIETVGSSDFIEHLSVANGDHRLGSAISDGTGILIDTLPL